MRHHDRRLARHVTAAVSGALLLSACYDGPVSGPRATQASPSVPPTSSGVPPSTQIPDTVTLAFAGDVHFEGGLTGVVDQPGSTLGPMSRALRAADLAMVNLESALTSGGTPASKELEDPGSRYWFRSPPAALDVLDRSGVDVVSLANNHGADYGATGLRDSVRIAEQSPVAVVGVGRDDTAAYAPYRTSIRGTDVAVLSADASPRESADPTWAAGPGSGPGLASARAPEVGRLLDAVRAAAAVDDIIVVYLHWGRENDDRPSRYQQVLATALAEAGADVVVGTHAHVLLGAGMIGSTYVSYGLGNFFWYHGDQPTTGVLTVSVRAGEVVADEWLPAEVRAEGGNPRPVSGAARAEAQASWRGLRVGTGLTPGPGVAGETAALPAYISSVRRLDVSLRRRMRGSSHDPATCPVPLADLRRLAMSYVGFDGLAHRGVMVVHRDVAADVVEVFSALYAARFPIRRMRLIDAYGGDDNASMAADNTSGYNCRTVAGQDTFSDHAYGRAIDINPVENPYVLGDQVLPPAGRGFVTVDRTAGAVARSGVIRESDAVTESFERLGWTWGGTWSDPDFQHFSAP